MFLRHLCFLCAISQTESLPIQRRKYLPTHSLRQTSPELFGGGAMSFHNVTLPSAPNLYSSVPPARAGAKISTPGKRRPIIRHRAVCPCVDVFPQRPAAIGRQLIELGAERGAGALEPRCILENG